MTMTAEEIEATAQRTAALVLNGEAPAVTAAPVVAATTPSCSCQHTPEPVTADAVARSDAPAALAPEDGLQPMSPWEAECTELRSRLSALENRMAAFESDVARLLIENTNLLTIG